MVMALVAVRGAVLGGEVRGRVEMPAGCSPEISPAVVWLEPKSGQPAPSAGETQVTLEVHQKALQFRPRVRGMGVGQRLKFTNGDSERHNVHIQGAGVNFSRTIAPGETVEFEPTKAGLLRIFCDIHVHMRAFAVVSASPWVATCDRTGAFRLRDVPEGAYTLHAWHELGDPATAALTVGAGTTDAGTIRVEGPQIVSTAAATPAKAEKWEDVVDRVSVALASALDVASRKVEGSRSQAVGRVDEAYFGVFEGSDMETAVRSSLGYDRAVDIEDRFLSLRREARAVAEGRSQAAAFVAGTRELLQSLLQATRDLNALGVTDRTKVLASGAAPTPIAEGELRLQLAGLRRTFDRVGSLVEKGNVSDARDELVESGYFRAFEPMERQLNLTNPSAVKPLESRFASLRGQIESGLRGAELREALDALYADIAAAMQAGEGRKGTASVFGLAFSASLVTILREGIEVILLLTMLLALVAKAGRPRGASRALWMGVVLAVVASGGTALALNRLVSSARGRAGEVLEGTVMLAAAAVLFYVSYWLISRAESKRWMDFLRRKTTLGGSSGRFLTLGLAAFLAVYREGAETALMYQALAANQPPQGMAGLVAGLAVGLVLLAVFAVALRFTSVRLPLRRFFQVTGLVLFAMSVVFAGHGVLELQVAGVLKSTPVPWLSGGLPALGLHPSLQGVAIQGLLLAGAAVSMVVLSLGREETAPTSSAPGKERGEALAEEASRPVETAARS
jgi:high-affinity iron transporter